MATLTAEEIEHIRNQSGDNCEPYDVSDAYMQWLHDNRASNEPLCAFSSEPLGATIVWVLRARAARAQKLTDASGEAGSTSFSQKRKHIKEDLEEWEAQCGYGGGVITTSTLSLGLDRANPDTEYAALQDDPWWNWGYFG